MERIEIDKLGPIIKAARKSRGHTRERLAERIHITPRYLMSIENENKSRATMFYSGLFVS